MNRLAHQNPFAQQRLESIAWRFPDGLGWSENLKRLDAMAWRACIVGPQGTGKSTLLRELHWRLNQRGQCGVDELKRHHEIASLRESDTSAGSTLMDVPRCGRNRQMLEIDRSAQRRWLRSFLADVPADSMLLVDGIERLSRSDRSHLIQSRANADASGGLIATVHRIRRFDRLKPWVTTAPSKELLLDLLRELEVDTPQIVERANRLLRKHRTNMRSVLRTLYEDWSDGKIG